MKKFFFSLLPIFLMTAMCVGFNSCGDDEEEIKSNTESSLSTILRTYKWVGGDYDVTQTSYGGSVSRETDTFYFLDGNQGYWRWISSEYDSSLGRSRSNGWEHFTYNVVSGNTVKLVFDNGSADQVMIYSNGLLVSESSTFRLRQVSIPADDEIYDYLNKKEKNDSKEEETEEESQSAVREFTVKGVSFKMVRLEGGTFQMGATPEQGSDAYDREQPVHSVTLSGFSIGQTEVTQALWQAVMSTTVRQQRDNVNPSYKLRGEGDNYPMYYISWEECQTFITKLNQLTGQKFRLPTEAEWEYAARGGNQSMGYKYSGSNTIGSVAWYTGNSSQAHPVAMKQPNELGIYDMSGNVDEWCQDWYDSYKSSAQLNPKGPYSGSTRVRRGNSWYSNARSCRVSYRNSGEPSGKGYNVGFRLAL